MKKSILFILTIITFSSHSQTRLESSFDESFSGISWEKTNGYNYEYDNNKNLIKQTDYVWNGSGWTADYKTTYTYNSNNKVIEQIEQSYDGTSQFVNENKSDFVYNSSGMLTQITAKYWGGTQWENSDRNDIHYTNSKFASMDVSYYNGSTWELEEKYTATYTGNNITELYFEEFDGASWEPFLKISYTFNSNNVITNAVYEEFDGFTWSEYFAFNYTYDASLNRLKETMLITGVEYSISEYTYDTSAPLSNFATPFRDKTGMDYLFEGNLFVSKVLGKSSSVYDSQSNTYFMTNKTTYNYNNPLVLNIESNEEIQNISLYPNPSNDFIQLSGISKPEKVVVYSLSGVKTIETVINENEKIDIQNLSNGLYLLKFENGNTLKFSKN